MPEFIAELVPAGLDDFTAGYLEAAEWLLDEEYRADAIGFSPEFIAEAREVCQDFKDANAETLESIDATMHRHGVDFWLTRNGHGAGFWDRGYGEAGDVLSKAAKAYGSCDPYVGNDGYIYA